MKIFADVGDPLVVVVVVELTVAGSCVVERPPVARATGLHADFGRIDDGVRVQHRRKDRFFRSSAAWNWGLH